MVPGKNFRGTRALRRVLSEVAADGRRPEINARGDSLVVELGGHRAVLSPVWAGEGFPADIRAAIRAIHEVDPLPAAVPVVVAREMSPGARKLLGDDGISWADERGRARIVAPGLVIVRDEAPPGEPSPDPEMSWADGSAAIAEYVLTQAFGAQAPRGWMLPALSAIADAIGVSAPLVSRTLRMFDREGWTQKGGPERGARASRSLMDPTGLLSSWAAWRAEHRQESPVHAHALFRDPEALVSTINDAWVGVVWAVTGWLALDRRAPFTSVPTVDLYVDATVLDDLSARQELLAKAGMREVEAGARVLIRPADRYLVRGLQRAEQPRQVTDVRLYADLLGMGVRGADAAEHLRQTRLGI